MHSMFIFKKYRFFFLHKGGRYFSNEKLVTLVTIFACNLHTHTHDVNVSMSQCVCLGKI